MPITTTQLDWLIDRLIAREGTEFTNRPSDRGGPTKFGVTQRAWDQYCNSFLFSSSWRPVLQVANIERDDARDFYSYVYAEPLLWLEDLELFELIFDCAVNHGMTRAVRWLQMAVDETPDGIAGPRTKAAVLPAGHSDTGRTRKIYRDVLVRRFKFYAQIASDQLPTDPDLPNLRGWISRATEFI